MKLEVLYIEGCPNHRPAVEQVVSVLGRTRKVVRPGSVTVAALTLNRANLVVFLHVN
jgi:hypothetical protein